MNATGATCAHLSAITALKHAKRRECDECVKIGSRWVHRSQLVAGLMWPATRGAGETLLDERVRSRIGLCLSDGRRPKADRDP